MLKVESARIAETRDSSDDPIYIPATVVGQKEFIAKSDYSSEKLLCEFNSYIGVNPAPAAAVSGEAGSVELVYRKRPTGYLSQSDWVRNGVLLSTLNQDSEVSNIFSTETLGVTIESLGLDYSSLIGGKIIMVLASGAVSITTIDQVWDDAGGSFTYLHVSNWNFVYNQSTFSNAHIIERYVETQSGNDYADDSASPELPEEFHGPMLDIALGKFLLPYKPQEAAQFIGYANQALQAYGITLATEYGGAE